MLIIPNCSHLQGWESDFLGLPAELRLCVYRYVFRCYKPIEITVADRRAWPDRQAHLRRQDSCCFLLNKNGLPRSSGNPDFLRKSYPAFLRVSRQLLNEASGVLYGENTFSICWNTAYPIE